ncbi:MAG: RHS repeat-associated core domain-containing protein [Muribaculaceae bacterium]|nr:RHS repeat-associated core domain-containing protein [Muribaculaceae bacterium]
MAALGNNRAVINGTTGAVEQTVAYYPFGGVIADLGTPAGGQPYKFGGKELLTANGLNEYDFGARRYYPAVPHFTSIDPLCENYYPLSPYLYCGNDPVNFIDKDGRETYLWTTKLPGSVGNWITPATHSFITVTIQNNDKKVTHYFAYGSKEDGLQSCFTGQLVRCRYEDDLELIKGNMAENDRLKDKFLINPPDGMTQEDFDNAVKDIANSFGNQEGISYSLNTSYPLDGNCNSSTYTILHKAGVSEEVLMQLDKQIQGLHWGWGQLKPWTKEEQIEAIKAYPKFDFETKRYEILQNALP